MNWFPVFSASAVVAVAFLGLDHPGRAIVSELVIVAITILGMSLAWWKQSRLSTNSI